mgnify:CR=1 FL=1
MMEINQQLKTCLEKGLDYGDGEDILHITTFVRMYKLDLPTVCWMTHNGLKEVSWNKWQIFDLIRQNNIHPDWMRKEDHDELYSNYIPQRVEGYPPQRTDDPGGGKHRKHRRRNHSFGQSYA